MIDGSESECQETGNERVNVCVSKRMCVFLWKKRMGEKVRRKREEGESERERGEKVRRKREERESEGE